MGWPVRGCVNMDKKIIIGGLVFLILVVGVSIFTYNLTHKKEWCKPGQFIERTDLVKNINQRFMEVRNLTYNGENVCWIRGESLQNSFYVVKGSEKAYSFYFNRTSNKTEINLVS